MCAIFYLVVPAVGFAQNYGFTNYSVEQGLVQSQAQDIAQDEYGYIWIATLGGISRFDGFNFHNYTKKDGLLSLLSLRVCAGNKKIYFGTQEGIQSYDGHTFETFDLPENLKSNSIVDIVPGKDGRVFFRTPGKLFSRQNGDSVLQVKEFEQYVVTTIATDKAGDVYAAVYKKGIYQQNNNQWKLFSDIKKFDSSLVVQRLFFRKYGHPILLTSKGIYSVAGDHLKLIVSKEKINPQLTSVEEDDKGRLWIGTAKGTYFLEKTGEVEYVGSASGLTDNSVFEISKDNEGNLWFATDGDGIYKLNNTPITYFNSTQGINGNVVMGIAAESEKKVWLGTSENGLQKYEDGKFSSYTIPSQNVLAQKVNSLFFDSNKQLWIGTLGGGLWVYKDGKYKEILTGNGNHFKEVISIYEDSGKTIWVCISSGLFYFANGSMHKVKGLDDPCFSVIEKSPGVMLAGVAEGLWQVTGKSDIQQVNIPGSVIGTVNCFAKWKDYILLGTEDAGVVFWDPVTGKTLQCSSKNGLSSDFIFSLYSDNTQTLFAGTGHGISKIDINEATNIFSVQNYSSSNSLYGPECNLNAVQKTDDGKLWFGTTKGLVIYNQNDPVSRATTAFVY
ncbi:MAG TPA: two-component regulator propeller domain-containing protein, partial [Chitinophagaceae bacterium]|nr:two-component regulator propeller domain-containing protein [Chitinophagaceae bacterium]